MFRPPKARAVEVACALDTAGDLSTLPATNFAHVLGGTAGGPAVRAALDALVTLGALVADQEPRMFVYRAAHGGKRWMGLVCGADTRDLVHLFPNAAADEAISAAEADLTMVDAQLVPGLIFIDASADLSYLFVCDTNERPAYHFVASDGATHSAWEVRHPDAYLPALAELAADELHAGAAQVIAAHVAGQMPLVILTGYGMIHLYGGMAGVRWPVHTMMLLGLIMGGVFAWLFFGPYRVFRGSSEPPVMVAALESIRKLVGINLLLGLISITLGFVPA